MNERQIIEKPTIRQYILTSYKELLKLYSPEKISVKQIATQAGINRSTFYLHFQDKYEVLYTITEEKLKELASHYYGNTNHNTSPLQTTTKICEHIFNNRLFYKKLVNEEHFKNRLFHYLYEALAIHLKHEAFTTFTAYGTMGYMIEWIKNDCQKPIKVIANDLSSIADFRIL
ncbi:TetR/AcrR family transcriptional regulator C-terminal domain-containing protein [Metasolibacillus sp. FSL K6-0083]|uniref:TetR/AcrR family transcriptional regulator C-terminal domain-containing protein n=1 Tax=Metasolibacillus sp. FSL K6-0083 TaxID=2921416 RepID=UPI00315ACD85